MKRAYIIGGLGMLAAAVSVPLLVSPNTAEAKQASLQLLDTLDAGEWEVRYRDGSATDRICARDGRAFIQLRHSDANCRRFVVEEGPSEVTVQYTCRGNGYGRTSIRRESARLAQIEAQGIAGGTPFQFTAEARRVGPCR